ncbi:hypothetical protein SISNIDRAFT_512999 [Sistotremastrum niveocremeum HHB9708]|uniref:DUF6535 domain-containing protein n=1 Tax=Sistotremastrum niveocremeum HHB9708 TaxID=1314777 RepID=A0A164T4W5_9AGAM|nr:hypothetical protein SISNIDRAFT_512999 [Sistotremastrum niveocremeum HHB9708]
MRSRKTSSSSSRETPAMAAKEDLAPKFDRMIGLMEEQNKMIGEQGKTLKEHSKMLEALETDATRVADNAVDDKAYEGRGLKDESTWGALDKEALAKMKVLVDGWKDLMNVSLIFIALFLTVVTAFISPIIQLFSTPSLTNSRPSLPSTSLQLVALFYYLALMFSICNSVMCVLGLQWAGRLLSVPLGKTNLERALNRERRKVLAEQRLLPLMGVLFWTLLLSIAFFVIGFLIQFWALSFSFDERAPILVIGAVAATALAITILGVILATTYHATVHKNSPFESPLSSASTAAWIWMKQVMRKSNKEIKKETKEARRWHQPKLTSKYLKLLRRRVQGFSRWIVTKLFLSPVSPSHESSGEKEEIQDEPEPAREEDKSIEILMKENEEDSEGVQALKAYARLVINTNDAEVLERVVPSFELGEWCKSGGDLLPVFVAVRERFLATDTSFRVKETVKKQLVYCREWKGWRKEYGHWRKNLEGNAITRFCRDQCKELVRGSHDSHRQFFPSYVFFSSFDPDNDILRGNPFHGSYEQSVTRTLSSYDRDGESGDREDVFKTAVFECNSLLEDGRSDDVTRILSRGYRSSLLRSLLRNPHMQWYEISGIVALITRGNEVAVLEEMAEFSSNLPDMKPVGYYERGDLLVIDLLGFLIPSLPSTFTVTQSFDLAPVLTLLLRYQSVIRHSLPRYIDTLFYVLDHGGFEALSSKLSSLRSAHDFVQFCLRSTSHPDRARIYLGHEALVALPPPSPEELQHLIDALQSYQDNMSSEDLEENFVDAVKECDSLCRDGKQTEIKGLLSHVDRVSLLRLILQNSRFSGRHILGLMPLIMEGNELQHIHAAPALLANIPSWARSDGDLPILAFLASLIQFLPAHYIVPPEFDLSQTLKLFMANDPVSQTWRKHSDTLIHYLHRGAFDTLSDQGSVRPFLNMCISPLRWMTYWNEDQKTSTLTRERAIQLKKKPEELDAARAAALLAADSRSPEKEDKPPSLALRVWDAVTQRLGDSWRWKRKGRTTASRAGD